MLQQFTSQWRKEYLLNLRENSRVNKGHQEQQHISVGDMIILMNDKTNRNFWQLGKVEELLTGNDGIVRAAKISVGKSDGRPGLLWRSIQHLIPLEVKQDSKPTQSNSEVEEPVSSPKQKEHTVNSSRPRRAAAVASELLREELLNDKLL